jgi:anti-anti-sigma regulatory factor
MRRLLFPGMTLLNRLRYPQKFALLNAMLTLPLLLAIALLYSETRPRITFAEREILGTAYIRRVMALYPTLSASQRLVYAGRPAEMAALQGKLAAEIAAIGQDTRYATLGVEQPLARLRKQSENMAEAIAGGTPAAIGQAHLKMYALLRDEIRRVGDSSNLILDPELNTYYLMEIAVVQIPSRLALVAEAQNQIDMHADHPEQIDFAALFELNGRLDANILQTESAIQKAIESDPSLSEVFGVGLSMNTSNMQSLVALLRSLDTNYSQLTLAAQYSVGAADTSMGLWGATLSGLDQRLQLRVSQLAQKNMAALAAAGLMLLFSVYLLVAFYRTIMDAVETLDLASKRLLSGGGVVRLETRDELGQVVTSFNRVAAALVAENAARQQAEQERAQLQEETIRAQAASLDDLTVPLLPLQRDLLLLPLVGTIDSRRADQILETLLRGVVAHHAQRVIIDLTGVRVVDTQVARALIDAAQGVHLLGAEVVLAGLRAEVAHTIVQLGIDLDQITFYASLQDAIAASRPVAI